MADSVDAVDAHIDDCLKLLGPAGAVRVLSYLFEKTEDLRYLTGCACVLPNLVEDLRCFSDLMWNINRKLFELSGRLDAEQVASLRYQHMVPSYFKLLNQLAASLGKEPTAKIGDANSPARVVFVSHQLLDLTHSPTRVCFDYSAELIKQGVEVLIINAEALPGEPLCGFHNPMLANNLHELPPTDARFKFAGVEVTVWSEKNKTLSKEKVRACLQRARAFSPSLVLSHGEFNVVGDLLAKEYPTICLPTGRMEPISTAHVFVDYAGYFIKPLAIIRTGVLDHEPEILRLPATVTADEAKTKWQRSSLGLSADDRVFVVVGNRLQQELGERFERLILNLFAAAPQAKLVLVGLAAIRWSEPALAAYANRIVFRRYETDLLGLYSICDVFLNPPRQGGGNSANIALHAKLPILTLGRCDVASVVGEKNTFTDDQEIERAAIAWATDMNELKKARHRALKIREEMLGVEEIICRLRSFFDEAAKVFVSSNKSSPAYNPPDV